MHYFVCLYKMRNGGAETGIENVLIIKVQSNVTHSFYSEISTRTQERDREV